MFAGLPPQLASRANAVLRPRDARAAYAHPGPELARLARRGLLKPLAHGYYVRVPQSMLGEPDWRPDLHAAALGIAQADLGPAEAALMHLSAARVLGALPRELAVAVVAVTKQRPALAILGGRVVFVTRHVDTLDLQRAVTSLGEGWVTTAEQTLLDLLHRPGLGDTDPSHADAAIEWLAQVVDWTTVAQLAQRQRRLAVLRRAMAGGRSGFPAQVPGAAR